MKQILSLFALLLTFSLVKAQQQNSCGTPPASALLLQEMNNNLRSTATFTIPVVFHVYYNEQTSQHVPGYAEIQRGLDTLNMRFAKLNPDVAAVYSGFKSIAADAQIEFQLARKDESGNCISGIFYHYSPSLINTSYAPNLNTNKYLNIHLVFFVNGGAGGFANYPTPWSATPDPGNDVVILGGGLYTKLLTHEAGHWLNLIHTFGNVNQTGACGDDLVSDTPESAGNLNCDTLQSICNPPIVENINNYMDYSSCGYMFTQGQVSRMQATLLDTTLSRRIVWTPSNLSATGVNPVPVCTFSMSPIAYQDFSNTCTFSPYFNFIAAPLSDFPDSVKWTFPGGIPAFSDSAVQSVKFSSNSATTVTLKAWKGGVQYTYTVSVSPTISGSNGLAHHMIFPYTQNFENNFSLPSGDLFVATGDTTWKINSAGYNSDSSLFIPAEHKLQTDTNKFYFGTFALTNTVHPHLKFKTATSHSSGTVYRKLFIYLRNRCTNTERLMSIQYDSVMAGSNTASPFVPTLNSQWKNIDVNLSMVATDSVRKEYEIRFELVKYFTGNKADENFYLDDINISDTSGAPPVADFSIENIHFCQSGCYQLECVDNSTGGPNYYSWGTFGGLPNNPVAKGCYYLAPFDTVLIYLTVYNEFGSSQVAKPVYIHTIYMDSVTVSPAVLCAGDTASLHFYSYHHINNTGETYLWTNNNTPLTPYNTLIDSSGAIVQATPNVNTTYNIHVQNMYGCSANYTKTVNLHAQPSFFLSQNKTCIGLTDSVTLSGTNGPGYVYNWAPAGDLNTSAGLVVHASPNATTNYSVTVSDGVCSRTQNITVNVSPVFPQTSIAAADTSFCSGQSLTLYAGSNVPVTNVWSWSPCCTGSYTVYSDSLRCGFLGTTTVTLTSTDTNGCSDVDTQIVTLSSSPVFWVHPFNNTFAGGNQILLCNLADSVCLMAQGAGNYSYNWSSTVPTVSFTNVNNANATFHNAAFSMAGFTLTATNSEGCQSARSFLINHQYQGNYPSFSLSPTAISICENASTNVNISPPGFGTNLYFWMPTTGVSGIVSTTTNQYNSGNGSSATITGTYTMTYTVTAIEAGYGCVASKTLQVTVSPAPTVNLGADTTICSGDTILLDAQNSGNTFLWSTNSTNQSILVNNSGQYSVAVTGGNTCIGYDTIQVNVTVCLENGQTEKSEPFVIGTGNGYFNLIPSDITEYNFSFYDLSGRKICRQEKVRGNFLLNVNNFSSGIYLLQIEQYGKTISKKLVLQ